MPAEIAAIKDAIMRGNVDAMQERLAKTDLSSDALQALLTHAFEQSSNPAIKEALLQHPACPYQAALELAVRHGDIAIARQALQKGADPEHVTALPGKGDDDMRTLLTYVRRKNILYPPHFPHDQGSALDRALCNVLDDSVKEKASHLLRQEVQGKNIQEAWRDAVKDKRFDIQRAILLLAADRNRHFQLLQEDPVTDEGVIKVMKEIPYFSPKRKLMENLNGKAMFSDKDEKILCRHLVEHRQTVQQRSGQIKFDYAQYTSKETIAAHVSYDTQAKHHYIKAHATETCLLHNHDFGKTLAQQFAAMTDKEETDRLILLESTVHAMSVELKIKKKEGKTYYVAKLFDPVYTKSHVRMASDKLRTFETLSLANFIATENSYKGHYPESDDLSIMFVRPSRMEEQAMANPASGAVENRTLTSGIDDKKISTTALFYMLVNGFAGDLRRLKNEIASRPEEEQIQLLAAKDVRGIPGLLMALRNGHADAIKAFSELLMKVPPEKRAALAAAKDSHGIPGLWEALQEGRANAIRAFGELLKLVPPEQRTELLAAKDAKGIPGLFMALQNGHANAVEAFGALLELVSPKERVELLTAKRADGMSALAYALKEGKLEALEQYIKIIKETAPALNAQERAALLKDIRKSHAVKKGFRWINYPYYDALKKNNPEFYLRFKEMKKALKS